MRVPCKITLIGDKDYARNFVGAAQSQLRILEAEMDREVLEQGVRRAQLNPRISVEATVSYQFREVKIYCEPLKKKEKKIEEGLEAGRFFAKVKKSGKVFFYWLFFKEDGRVFASGAGSSKKILDRMVDTPYTTMRATHSFTKSFMIKNDDDKDERWIAAPHLLVKEGEDHEGKKTLTEIFNPLGYPYAQNDLKGKKFRYYPLPQLFEPFGLTFPTHSAPPNRFYCNIEERKMVWYSCYSVLDYTFPTAPRLVHYCFGIILTLTDNMTSEAYYSPRGTEYQRITDPGTDKELIKTFNCYSSEVDSEGFDPLWYYQKPEPDCNPSHPPIDPMCGADADVPYPMLLDVNSLTESALEVFIPWSERPTKFTVDLTGPNVGTTESDHTYEQVNKTDHWYWTEDGFEQKLFTDLDQVLGSNITDYTETKSPSPHPGCNGSGEIVYYKALYPHTTPEGVDCGVAMVAAEIGCTGGCSGDTGNIRETFQGTWQWVYKRTPGGKSCLYRIYFPDKTLSMESHDFEKATVQGKYSEAQYCYANWKNNRTVYIDGVAYTESVLSCDGPFDANRVAPGIRYIGEILKNKLVDSIDADWCSPNVIFAGAEKNRTYIDGYEEKGRFKRSQSTIKGSLADYYDGTNYANQPCASYFADSYWYDPPGGYRTCDYGAPHLSFQSYKQSVAWGAPIDSESFVVGTSLTNIGGFKMVHIDEQYVWKKYCDRNVLDKPLVLQYQVDGEITISSRNCNRTYYLDDRSSVDSEGLLVAARGATVTDYVNDRPIFDVATWGVVYKPFGGTSFIEVTNNILEALDCNVSELIELGLI